MTKKIIVAIDGLSSCGKSTMARELACEVGYAYIDTGAMYRAVTLYALRHALLSPDGAVDAAALERRMGEIDITFRVNPVTGRSETHLNGQNVEADIRGMEVSALVSRVSALPFVRRALVAQQQAMGKIQQTSSIYAQQKTIKLQTAVGEIARTKKLDAVLFNVDEQKLVHLGGTDITDDVIKALQ